MRQPGGKPLGSNVRAGSAGPFLHRSPLTLYESVLPDIYTEWIAGKTVIRQLTGRQASLPPVAGSLRHCIADTWPAATRLFLDCV